LFLAIALTKEEQAAKTKRMFESHDLHRLHQIVFVAVLCWNTPNNACPDFVSSSVPILVHIWKGRRANNIVDIRSQ
jgi:hypothetical protein